MTAVDDARALAQPVIDAAGIELVDVEMEGGILRITVDQEGGLPVGALTKVTRQISRLFDEDDPIPGRYTLEVSTPGLERKLRTPTHFQRAVGSVVTLRLSDRADGGARRIQASLSAADDDGITVVPDGTDEPVALRYDQVDKARTVFVWDAEPKNDTRPPKKKKAN